MTGVADAVRAEYVAALQDYLGGAGEAALQRGYELGREAMAEGLGVLEVAALHYEALMIILPPLRTYEENAWMVKAANDFFAESLSPFEITHRGYQEANVMLQHALQFAAVVCHELRTPLTSIQASTGMLQEILSPDPEGRVGRLLTNILAGAAALNARMNDLVDMAGFQSGSLSIHIESVDAGRLLRESCQRLEPVVRRAGLGLHTEIPANLPTVKADPRRLEQVLSNLVHNAIKFGSDGKRIEVRARYTHDYLVIEVQDYGKGISPADQSKLFQPYVRVEQDRQRTPGLGIGLALCRQLIQAHGGQIGVDSQPGRGSRFEFSLPLDKPALAPEEQR